MEKASKNTKISIKRNPKKNFKTLNDIYITRRSNFQAQQKLCLDLLNSGLERIFLHCCGNAINRGINLALNLMQSYSGSLAYAINTSTIKLIDELHPLYDIDGIEFSSRANSVVHICLSKQQISSKP